jgi:AcrR family transcriptional regulator
VDKADAILTAALALFAERGFYGTTVPEVAERAGVGAGTIYRYFESKEAIVNALYQKWKQQLAVSLMGAFPFDAPARAQLDHFVGAAFQFARQYPLAFKFLEMHHHQPYLNEASHAIENLVLDPARAFFDRHQAEKTTRAMPGEVLGAIVWGGIVGLVKAAETAHVDLTKKAEQHAADVLWDAIKLR